MVKHSFIRFLALFAAVLCPQILQSKEIKLAHSGEQSLETAGAAYAPLDVSKPQEDTAGALTKSRRNDLVGQFKGLVHMGLKKVPYERWQGKEMADCEKSTDGRDPWSYRCQIMTGEGSGFYYFYPNESRQSATLQELDIRVDVADEKVLDDMRRPVQELFGACSIVSKPAVHAKPRGLIRHWSTGEDVAELFIDHSVRPEGSVRFVWMRSPLVGTKQASIPFNTGS